MNRGLRIGSGSRLGGLGAFGIKGGGVSDTVRPSVVITSSETSPSAAATIPLTITFSESVTGFAVGDITVAGCTLSGFSGSGAVYTVTATPTAYEMTVDIAANVCVDGAGNQNTAATQFTMSCLVKWFLAGAIPAANCIVAYKPIGTANITASLTNLANPGTYDATYVGGAPGWGAATGWVFTLADHKAINTNYVPAEVVTRSAIARIANGISSASELFVFGVIAGGGLFGISATYANNSAFFYNGNGTAYTHGAVIQSGIVAVAGLNPYLNSIDLGDIGAGAYTLTAQPMYIGLKNNNGSATGWWTGEVQAFAEYDITLTPTQVAALSTAMAALN